MMPSFGEDVWLSDTAMDVTTDPFLIRIGELLVDLMELLAIRAPQTIFTAGAAIGRIILEQVGANLTRN